MKTSHEIRRLQLAALAEEVGGVRTLSEIINKTDVQIRQWINASKDSKTGKPRGISDDMARHIEELTGKEVGWLDNDPEALGGPPHWEKLSATQKLRVIAYIEGMLPDTPKPHVGADHPDNPAFAKKTKKAG